MPYFAYVIHSKKFNRYYKGHCQDLDARISEHNSGKTKSIKAFIPWELAYFEEFSTREEAIQREKYFKTSAGRRYLKQVLGN